ncbi:MAG TPA: hypothetical protein VF520_16185 [Thermoleophilaceae bacterium]|jgi:hypothetical protein
MQRLNRRSFMLRTGSLTAAAGAASLGSLGPLAEALAAAGTLDAARRRTYEALLESLALRPGLDLGGRSARDVADGFASTFYPAQTAAAQADLAFLLDTLDFSGGRSRPGSFAALDPHARLQRLRAGLADHGALGSESRAPRSLLTRHALGLGLSALGHDGRADPELAVT